MVYVRRTKKNSRNVPVLQPKVPKVQHVHGQKVPRMIFELGTSQLLVKCITFIGSCDTCKNTDASSILVFFSGCWEVSGKQDCHQSSCVANKKPPKALNNTKFCCCNSDLCNLNVSVEYVASQGDDPHIEPPGKNHVCR
jgi:hypothetical protein